MSSIIDKIIPLCGKRFEQIRDHPLEDAPEIIENRDLMYMKGNTAHCILFLDANGSDGILVEAEGSDYARKSEFISNARAIIEQSELTHGERQLHAELKAMADRIADFEGNVSPSMLLTMCGVINVPLLAIVAHRLAICSGVSVTSPCPMDILMTVTAFQYLP